MNRVLQSSLILFVIACVASLSAQEMKTPETSVVKITAQAGGSRRTGTGFIVRLSPDEAHIVTASHVVEGDNKPQVEFFTQRNKPVLASLVC